MPLNLSQFWLRHRGRQRWLYWDSVSTATNYKIRWGSATATYASSLSVGNVLRYKINDIGLATGGTHYMAVYAVSSASVESAASNELVIRDGVQV